MSTDSTIDINQMKTMIDRCSIDEKMDLVRFLEKDTFPIRFHQLLNRCKTNEITLDEITKEVECVRAKRYNDK